MISAACDDIEKAQSIARKALRHCDTSVSIIHWTCAYFEQHRFEDKQSVDIKGIKKTDTIAKYLKEKTEAIAKVQFIYVV